MDENADGGTVVSVATANSTSVTVDDDRFEVAGGNLKLKDGMSLDFEGDTSPISVEITASGDGASATHTVSVSINDVNEGPSVSADDADVDENASGAVLGAVAMSDPDAGDTLTATVDDERFEVAGGMLQLKEGMSLDHETEESVTLTVTVTDAAGLTATDEVNVSVNNVNEGPSLETAEGAVYENADGAMAGAVTVSDPDADDTHTYEVSDDRFEVADGMLKLKDGMSLDHESEDSVMVTITVTDAGGLTATADMTVAVHDVNEGPSVSADDADVDENASGAVLGAVAMSDPDAGDTLTATVDDERFEVAGGMLQLKEGMSLDHETEESVTLTVTVTDAAGLTATDEVNVSVNNVNEGPSLETAEGAVYENADGAMAGAVTVSDPDADDTHTYEVSDDRFEVADGMLKLKDGMSLDHESEDSVMVTITVTDAGGLTATADMTVAVHDVNEAPSISVADGTTPDGMAAASTIDENAAGVPVGEIMASDADDGDTLTYSVDDERFEAKQDAVGGWWVKLKDGMSLDHETADTVMVTVTVTDAAGLATSTDVTVTVSDVNEAPSAPEIRGLPRSVDENDEGAIIASFETGTDPEGDAVSFAVEDDRFEVIAGGVLKLKDDASLDFEAEGGSVDVLVTAMDPSGATSEATIVTVEVEDENETPSIMASDDDVDENDAGVVLSAITLSDPDAGDTHTVRISDFRFTAITDEQGGMWIALKEGESIDFEEEESIPLTLTVMDAGGLSGIVDVTITVNDVNENPSVSVASGITPDGMIAASTIDENAAGVPVGEITVSDPDADDTYTLSVSDPRFEAKQDSLGGWWVKLRDDMSLDHETEDSVTMTVTVTDAGGLTDETEVVVTVRNVDEAPSAPEVRDGPFSIDENAAGAVVTSLADSTDPEGDAITYSVDDERFEVTNGLVLKLKDGMSLDHEPEDSVTLMLTASDPAGNDSEPTMVTVAVGDVNEDPSVSVADGATPDGMTAASTINENAAGVPVGEITVSDPDDGDTHTYEVSDERFEAKQDELGGWWVKLKEGMSLDHETEDSVTVTVTVTDSGDLTAMTDVTVTVSDVNEAPTIEVASGAFDENVAGAVVGAVTSADVDDGDSHTYEVSDPRFEVADGMLKLVDGMSLDHETEDSVTVTVTVTDSGGLTAMADATVTINDVNEAPELTATDGTVEENAAGAVVGAVMGSDVDDGDTLTYTTSDPGAADTRFEVVDGMLKLIGGMSLDHETEDSVTVTVTVSDGELETSTDVTVTVADVNEDPSITVEDGVVVPGVVPATSSLTVAENAVGADIAPLASIVVTDPDADDAGLLIAPGGLTAVTVSDPRFVVKADPENGLWLALKSDVSLDFETEESVTVTVTFTDSADNEAMATATVTVVDGNEAPSAPVVRNAGTLNVDENDDTGATISSLADSTDPEGNVITYEVDDPRFEIDANQILKLRDGESLDHEAEEGGSVTIMLTAKDDQTPPGTSEATMVTITVNDLNEAPQAVGELEDIEDALSGGSLSVPGIFLEELFSDEDDTDTIFTYMVDGPESWNLVLKVESVTHTVTAPTVNDAEFVYTPPMEEEEEEMGNGNGNGMEEEEEAEPTATPIVQVTITDPDIGAALGRGDEHTYAVNDERFEIDEDGMLSLKAGEVLEEDTTVMVAVTDRYGLTGTGTVTITIAMEEEEGMEDGMDMEDGMGMDDGDGMEEEMPDPDTKEVLFINGDVTGNYGEAGDLGTYTIAVVATDDSGESGRAEFEVVVDDGNDVPTAINLANADGTDNIYYDVTVDENDDSGVQLGTLSVEDLDLEFPGPGHPNAQHEWSTDNDKFVVTDSGVLMLMAGESLDYEGDGAAVTVTVTVEDGGGAKKSQEVRVNVTNKNDAPEAADEIGGWWVTVDDDLRADDITEGQVISFYLESEADEDDNPAFTDQDARDSLTYEIVSGPGWLQIDEESGRFTNVAEELPEAGNYMITVRATDGGEDRDEMDADGDPVNTDGASAEVTFMLSVVVSDDGENFEPDVSVELVNRGDYDEGTGAQLVARVTVEDEDFLVAPHPFGVLASDEPILSDTANFELSDTFTESADGTSRTWEVWTTEGNSLDHEGVDDVQVTVTATDEAGAEGSDVINIDVEDSNEAPEFDAEMLIDHDVDTVITTSGLTDGGVTVEQESATTVTLYLNLYEMWSDPDGGDDVDELAFTAKSETPWITVHDPALWEDIKYGADGEQDDMNDAEQAVDDIVWPGSDEPDDDDMVVIVEIDRTAETGDTGQSEDGAIMFTATDEGGETGEGMIEVAVTDEDLNIPEDATAVTINGTPQEGNGLTMNFDHTKDPDYADGGEPVLVVYTWSAVTVDAEGDEAGVEVLQTSTSPTILILTQEHVGMKIRASVQYYEQDEEGGIQVAKEGGTATTMDVVDNVQDAGTANIVLVTTGTMLVAEVNIDEPDGYDDTMVAYTWESSVNGTSGWTAVAGDATDDLTVDVGDDGGGGNYFRLIVTYTDNDGVDERIVSGKEKVGALAAEDVPTVTGSLNAGGTLMVAAGGGSVQWQKMTDGGWVDIAGATGDLTLTDYHAGMTLRALVTHTDGGNVTAIVATGDQLIAVSNTAPVATGTADEITATVPDPDAGAEITRIDATVDLNSLFQDAEGDTLTYTIGIPSGLTHNTLSSGEYVYVDVDSSTGTAEITYITDDSHGQGANGVLTFTVTADDDNGGTETQDIVIRLNVAPTNLNGTGSGTRNEDIDTEQSLGTLTVLDENNSDHEFGQYDWTVSDPRFEITVSETDSKQAALTVKADAAFAVSGADESKDFTVTVTATDKAGGHSIEHEFTLTVSDGTDLEPDLTTDPATPEDTVPGLKDDDTDDSGNDETDGADGDNDGGLRPPPDPAMMFEDDLLGEFILAIDDMDIA